MFGVGFCFLAVMYVLSTDVVVERNEKKKNSDDVRYGPPLKLLVLYTYLVISPSIPRSSCSSVACHYQCFLALTASGCSPYRIIESFVIPTGVKATLALLGNLRS